MQIPAWLLTLLFITTTPLSYVYADDLELKDGRVLKNYRILNHSPKDAMIIHDDGADSVLLKDFPEDLRKKYGYDEEAVKAHEAEQEKATERYKEQQEKLRDENQKRMAEFEVELAERKRLKELFSQSRHYKFTITSVTEGGIIAVENRVELKESIDHDGKTTTRYHRFTSDEVYFIVDAPVINAVDGKEFSGYFTRIGTYTYTTVSGNNATAAKLIHLPHVQYGRSKPRLAPDLKEQKELLREQQRIAAEFGEQLTDEAKLRDLRSKAFHSTFTVLSVTKGGILARGAIYEIHEYTINGIKRNDPSVFPEIGLAFIVNYPSDGVIDAQKLDGLYALIGRHTYTAVSGARKTVVKLFYFEK